MDTREPPEVALSPVVPTQWWRIRGAWALRADRRLVHSTGFSYMAWQNCKLRHVPYTPCLLLTTVGRRSGLLRQTVLPHHPFGDGAQVVIGSNSGSAADPDWVNNLRADSRCWFRLHRCDTAAVARIAEADEREQALAAVIASRPYARQYEERTRLLGRQMPVVIIRPRREARSDEGTL